MHHNCWCTICAPYLCILIMVRPSIIAYMIILFVVGVRLSRIFMLLGLGCGWWF